MAAPHKDAWIDTVHPGITWLYLRVQSYDAKRVMPEYAPRFTIKALSCAASCIAAEAIPGGQNASEAGCLKPISMFDDICSFAYQVFKPNQVEEK